LYPVKEAFPKRKPEKVIREKNQDVFFFRKTGFPVLFGLALGLITPYSLGV